MPRGSLKKTPAPLGTVIAITVSAVLVAAGTASAVSVNGSLAVPREFSPPPEPTEGQPAGFYWEERNGFLDTHDRRVDPRRALAVVLLGTGAGDPPASEFEIRGGDLWPTTMVAQANSDLKITNTDGCAHELYAEGLEGFTPIQTAPGNARTLGLPASGSFEVRDRVYAHVHGHLHVVDDLVARAEVGADGRFQFADVPAGQYTLKVFYGAQEIASQPITVEDGRELTIDTPVALDLTSDSE